MMVFVSSGEFHYCADEAVLASTSRNTDRLAYSCGTDLIKPGHFLCEAVLWTRWNHQGELTAMQDSSVMAIDALSFGAVIVQHSAPCVIMTKYAQHFIYHLNRDVAS